MENKTRVLIIARSEVRRDVSRTFAVNLTVLKEYFRAAEDEVDVSFDVTVFKELTTAIDEQRVLPSEKTTVLKNHAIGISKKSDCLRTRTERVLERYVFGAEIVRINERAKRQSCVTCLLRTQPISQDCCLRVVTSKSQKALAAADANLFFVSTGFDANDNASLIIVRDVIDCLLDRLEITGSISSHN